MYQNCQESHEGLTTAEQPSATHMAAVTRLQALQDVPLDRPLGKVPPGYLRSLCPASTCSSFQSTRTSIASSFADHAPSRGCAALEPRLSTIQERSHEVRPVPGRHSATVDQQRFPSLHRSRAGPNPAAAGKPSKASAVAVARHPGAMRATSAPAGARSHVHNVHELSHSWRPF